MHVMKYEAYLEQHQHFFSGQMKVDRRLEVLEALWALCPEVLTMDSAT